MDNIIVEYIKSRRSIRNYKDEQISDKDLNTILEAAIFAPSGSNSQSWLFTVIQNKGVLQQLNILVRKGLLSMELEEDDYPAKKAACVKALADDFNFYYKAPTLIIASNLAAYPNAIADCSLATQNIFLAAHSISLGSCWINQLSWLNDNVKVREFLLHLGIPIDHRICSAASIGLIEGNYPLAKQRKENTIKIVK